MRYIWRASRLVLVVFIASLVSAASQPISLVHKSTWPGFTRGSALGVVVRDGFAFVTANQGGLMIFDVTTPSSPRLVSAVPYLGWTVQVKLAGDYAYVTSLYSVSIIDVSDPQHPEFVGSMNHGGRSIGIDVVGSLAYVADE